MRRLLLLITLVTCACGVWNSSNGASNAGVLPIGASVGRSVTAAAPRLAPAQAPVRVMLLGDSITYGARSTDGGGYRTRLWELLRQQYDAVDFVGSSDAGPSWIDRANEGHSGYMIRDLLPYLDQWLQTYQPQIILLHIGTNDIGGHLAPAAAAERLRRLLRQIFSVLPQVQIIVAQITPLCVFAPQVADYNARIPAIAASFVGHVPPIRVVDMQHTVGLSDLADCVHPNDRGYAHMADQWFAVLQPLLGSFTPWFVGRAI